MESLLKMFDLSLLDGVMIPLAALVLALFISSMQKIFFGPLVALYEAREAATSGAQSTAEELLKKAADLSREYEQGLFEARVIALEKKLQKLSQARSEADASVHSAEQQAKQNLAQGRATLETKLAVVRDEASKEVNELAEEIVRRILGAKSSVTSTVSHIQ